jgi:predicted nuclease of predicted toxin-antitoxin system
MPPAQMERFVDRALQLGKPVQIEWFEAGHVVTAQVDQSIRDQERMLDFALKVLARAGRGLRSQKPLEERSIPL